MKKILSMVLVLVLVAGIAVSGTMAYLTDRDNATNVFTVGDVDIELSEEFTQNAELLPGKVVTKKTTITNNGNAAWVWLTYAVPTALTEVIDVTTTTPADNGWKAPTALGTTDVGTVNYTVYGLFYQSALGTGDSVTGGLESVMLDPTIDIAPDGQWHTVENGVATKVEWTTTSGNPTIYVDAYAIQQESFDTVNEAYDAYIGQWGGLNASNFTLEVKRVGSAAELVNAIANLSATEDNNIVLPADTELALDQNTALNITEDAVINLNGGTIKGHATEAKTSYAVKVAAGNTLTLSNGTVTTQATEPDTDWGTEGFPGYATNTIKCEGKLVIDGATIENKTASGGASYAIDCYAGADLVINSGTIKQTGAIKGDVAIRIFTSNGTTATNVTINDGEISGRRAIWVHLAGGNAAVAPIVNLTINGGKLISTDTAADGKNLSLYSYSYGNSFAKTNITINGGEFTGNVAFGGRDTTKGYQEGDENVVITGGTFHGTLGRYTNVEGGWEDIAKP